MAWPSAVAHLQPAPRGTWSRIQIGHRSVAVIRCPGCSAGYALLGDFSIDVHGFVQPSYRCPEFDCGTDVHLQLEGWRP